MPSHAKHLHTCTPETQGSDRDCLACTQQIYYDCLARFNGKDVPLVDAERFWWANRTDLHEMASFDEEYAKRYSPSATAAAFKTHRIHVGYELRHLRSLIGSRKINAAVRLKALEMLQSLRRELMPHPVPLAPATNPSGNGTAAPVSTFAKDEWKGRQ